MSAQRRCAEAIIVTIMLGTEMTVVLSLFGVEYSIPQAATAIAIEERHTIMNIKLIVR